MSDAITFEEVFTEAGIIPEWIERGRNEGREQTVRNLYSMGMSAEKIAQATELPLERVRALTKE